VCVLKYMLSCTVLIVPVCVCVYVCVRAQIHAFMHCVDCPCVCALKYILC
jgi:hypothetical protein